MRSKGQNRQRRKGLALQKKVRKSLGIEKEEVLLYDPPSGWRYGFPKPYRPLPGETLHETLLRDGYPQAEIDNGGGSHIRFIGVGGDKAIKNLAKQGSKK